MDKKIKKRLAFERFKNTHLAAHVWIDKPAALLLPHEAIQPIRPSSDHTSNRFMVALSCKKLVP